MAQNHLMFEDYTPPDPDEDGYQVAFAVTSTSSSGRTMRGPMINTPMFTVESYNLKWTDIAATDVKNILSRILGKPSFSFFHFNVYTAQWETSQFYVANVNSPVYRLNDGEERVNQFSFQVTAIDPL